MRKMAAKTGCKEPLISEISRIIYGVKLKIAAAVNCIGRVFSTSANVFLPTFLSVLTSMMECVNNILTTHNPTAMATSQMLV